MTIELGVIIAVIGCVIGALGYVAGRDKKIANDAEWRGEVNAKLDVIVGISRDMASMRITMTEYESRISSLESDVKSAHSRLDRIVRKE